MPDLALRLTHKYVGTWSHLDQWKTIGTYEVVAKSDIKHDDEDDICDPTKQTLFIEVASKAPKAEVIQALNTTFTQVGCSHEHDCCGCRSYYATATHLIKKLYTVILTSSRNY